MLRKLEILLKNEIDPAFAKRASFIFQVIDERRPKTILEVGCGRGFYLQALCLYDFPTAIHGIDINIEYIKIAKHNCRDKRVSISKASAYDIPYKNNYFDAIICSEVLEHLSDEKKGLSEMKRVLKPGGTILITVPNENFPLLWDPLNWLLMRIFKTHVNKNVWWLAGIWAGHERLYTKATLTKAIREEGLSINKARQFVQHAWPLSHFILYGVGKNLIERCGVKSFNRFSFKDKQHASIIAAIFRLPSMFDDKKLTKASVSLCVEIKKD